LARREKEEKLGNAAQLSAHFELAEPMKSPEKREIQAKTESNSLSRRLSGGGCSHQRTRLCPKIPVNREIYREFWRFSGPVRVYRHLNT
jgi:hypothetical protein